MTAAGPAGWWWVNTRKQLFASVWAGKPCYYCSHPIPYPGWDHGVVAHVISKVLRPDLAMDPSNWRPSHGGDFTQTGGLNKRCPECDLDCNWLAHNSPDAPMDGDRTLPFTGAFIARKVQQRRAQLTSRKRKTRTPAKPPQPVASPGRAW